MAESNTLGISRRLHNDERTFVTGPSYEDFLARFGNAFPKPQFLESDLGNTAVYDLEPAKEAKRQVLLIHGINTPALGMLPLARELQALDSHAHIVLFDLWGHGLSSTPLVAHTPQIFHSQILQVLAHMSWSNAHLVGFSFGGATTATFANYNPGVASSLTLIAPAGLMSRQALSAQLEELLDGNNKESEAAQGVLEWLGAWHQEVPEGWQEDMRSGRVIAKALKQWELDEHQGYRSSVLSMIRDGGVFEREEIFRQFAKLPTRKIAILGETDDVCSKEQLLAVGLSHIEVIEQADHELVRTRAGEIAQIVHHFWMRED